MFARILLFVLPLALFGFVAPYKILNSDCTYEGKKLYGKIKFVDSFPDVKVQFVCSFPDLKVEFVNAFADDCGEWQIVDTFPDLKVQIVSSSPDIKIQAVSSFPGMD